MNRERGGVVEGDESLGRRCVVHDFPVRLCSIRRTGVIVLAIVRGLGGRCRR